MTRPLGTAPNDGKFRLAFFKPVLLLAVLLIAVCIFTAVYLFSQQSKIADVLRENVASRSAATDLRVTLNSLIELERKQIESVSELHDRAARQIPVIGSYADQSHEKELSRRIADGFAEYLQQWQLVTGGENGDGKVNLDGLIGLLRERVLSPCREIEAFNDAQIQAVTSRYEQTLKQLAWGMGATLILGAISGIMFGYFVSGLLSQTIQKLRIQIDDAAGKLAPQSTEIVVTSDRGFEGLHKALESLDEHIEGVVKQLHQREREVHRAEQLASLGKLAAGVGHELRNPLTSVKMLVQTGLEDDQLLSKADLKIIESEVRRMERSLQTFLAFARIPKPEPRRVNLKALIDDTFALISGRAKKQQVLLLVETVDGEITTPVDEGQFQQVLVNLAFNALDAMPRGGNLTVRTLREPHGIRVEVIDDGKGFSEEERQRLFEPFASTKENGLGLGLVISRRIIEEHGGTLTATHTAGGGATFVITLPENPMPLPAS